MPFNANPLTLDALGAAKDVATQPSILSNLRAKRMAERELKYKEEQAYAEADYKRALAAKEKKVGATAAGASAILANYAPWPGITDEEQRDLMIRASADLMAAGYVDESKKVMEGMNTLVTGAIDQPSKESARQAEEERDRAEAASLERLGKTDPVKAPSDIDFAMANEIIGELPKDGFLGFFGSKVIENPGMLAREINNFRQRAKQFGVKITELELKQDVLKYYESEGKIKPPYMGGVATVPPAGVTFRPAK
jgi:hypothetical protein